VSIVFSVNVAESTWYSHFFFYIFSQFFYMGVRDLFVR
jgi:hypothetical protein